MSTKHSAESSLTTSTLTGRGLRCSLKRARRMPKLNLASTPSILTTCLTASTYLRIPHLSRLWPTLLSIHPTWRAEHRKFRPKIKERKAMRCHLLRSSCQCSTGFWIFLSHFTAQRMLRCWISFKWISWLRWAYLSTWTQRKSHLLSDWSRTQNFCSSSSLSR